VTSPISNGSGSASRKPLRIMLVNGALFGGGAEHVIATLARHLRAAGQHVTLVVIHRGGELQKELEAEGFDVVSRIAEGASGLDTAARLRRLAEERAADVVHTHDLRSLIDVGLSAFRNRRYRHMHTFHFGNYPHVSWQHWLSEGLFARMPDQLVAVGNAQKKTIVSTFKLKPDSIDTIWNGVDYDAAVGPVSDSSAPLIGSVSTFGEQKGLPTLLEAAHILRSRGLGFRLMLVGDGPKRAELEAMAERLGIADCVEFAGWRTDAAKALLPTFDIFVQSSYWEAMSVVILEAMAAARAIVATSVGENADVLSHGQSAVLVPPRDSNSLADGLAAVISDVTMRRRLGAAAHTSYLSKFTGESMAERYDQAYRQLLNGSSS
jgi:glycosyltransferase involved in cell wall biosynthesis